MPTEEDYGDFIETYGKKIRSLHWSDAPGLLRLLSGAIVGSVWITFIFATVLVFWIHWILVWMFSRPDEYEEWIDH